MYPSNVWVVEVGRMRYPDIIDIPEVLISE